MNGPTGSIVTTLLVMVTTKIVRLSLIVIFVTTLPQLTLVRDLVVVLLLLILICITVFGV